LKNPALDRIQIRLLNVNVIENFKSFAVFSFAKNFVELIYREFGTPTTGVNFTDVLLAALTHADPKRKQRH